VGDSLVRKSGGHLEGGAPTVTGIARSRAIAGLAAIVALACLSACSLVRRGESRQAIVFTADTQGNVLPCSECGGGQGGLARRATIVRRLRTSGPSLLLLDAGNAFFGGDSLGCPGWPIVASYELLHYDAVNLSYRDFRFGKQTTLRLIEGAAFVPLSATLVDERTGRLLAKPYVVRTLGNRRIAIVGATELPDAVADLPHIKAQLAGITVRPVMEALREWLPRASAEADAVVLLFYGAAGGLKAITAAFPDRFVAVLVGGIRPDELPAHATLPVVATSDEGRRIAHLGLADARVTGIEQIEVGTPIAADPAMLALLQRHLAVEGGCRPASPIANVPTP